MGLCIDKFNRETCCFLVPGVWIKKPCCKCSKNTRWKIESFDHFQSQYSTAWPWKFCWTCVSRWWVKNIFCKNVRDANAQKLQYIYKKRMHMLHFLFVHEIPSKIFETTTYQGVAQTHDSSRYKANISTWFGQVAHVLGIKKKNFETKGPAGSLQPSQKRPPPQKISVWSLKNLAPPTIDTPPPNNKPANFRHTRFVQKQTRAS